MSLALVQRDGDPDALAIGDLYQKARSSIADSVRCLIKAGHRLAKKKDELGHGNWLPWLAANADVLGFDTPRTAQRLIDVASKYDAGVAIEDQQTLAISRQIWGHNVRGAQGAGENEWFTPAEYIELARAVLGEIDLDPATHAKAQETIRATHFFTKADDGLAKEWHGRVWLNPPYVRPLIGHFVMKLLAERAARRVTAGVLLTHAYTDSSWFQAAGKIADAICFTRCRIKFHERDGMIAAPTQGQAFFYFGAHADTFAEKFGPLGFVR